MTEFVYRAVGHRRGDFLALSNYTGPHSATPEGAYEEAYRVGVVPHAIERAPRASWQWFCAPEDLNSEEATELEAER